MAYYELDAELKCDMRQVEFFIKGGLPQESEIFNPSNLHAHNIEDIKQYKIGIGSQKDKLAHRQRIAPWIAAR